MDINPQQILQKFDYYDLDMFSHSQKSLTDHLLGTYKILSDWKVEEAVCLAGLCHSVYGTESFTKQAVPLSDRVYLINLIGEQAEELVYLFGCHIKKTFWDNLNKEVDLKIDDRFTLHPISINLKIYKSLVTMTLANWLEQRPRAPKEYHFIRQEEFLSSEYLLPKVAFESFKSSYGLY